VIVGREAGEVAGVAPEAMLLPIRATKSVALLRGVGVAKAVDHARRNGCHVISMSLGGVLLSGALEAAIDAAVKSGMIVMAAAGNWDWARIPLPGKAKFVVEPARYRNCIAVAASNADAAPWFGSSRGKKVLISAPGESVWVPALKGGANVSRSSGTSYGVAHMAGVAALWLAHWGPSALKERYGPENVQAVFVEVLRSGGFTRPDKWDTGKFGVGIVNAKAVLDAELPAAAPPKPKAAPRTSSRERLEAVLGAEEAGEVEPELAQLFRAPPGELDKEIDRLGDEVAYLLAENPDFLRHTSGARGPDEPADVEAVRALLASAGSPQLVDAVASEAPPAKRSQRKE
jgi:subtilisin family serine protease